MSVTGTADPVGSIIFSVFALVTISLGVLLVLRHYLPLRTTPAFYLLPIFFALWLPSILILLVPIDLASSAATDDLASRGIWLPQRVVLVSWRFTYWLTFALTWFILPVLAEYADTGYREPRDRLLYSLRANAQYYALVLTFGIAGLVYVFVAYEFSLTALRALVMALSYCWGLTLAIYLMGHGLVSIPRTLLRSASISGRLRRLQSQAPRAHERMQDAIASLEEVEFQVHELCRRKVGSAVAFRDWIEELEDMASYPPSLALPNDDAANPRAIPNVVTEKYLAELTRRLVRARHTKSRFTTEWARLVHQASTTQKILDATASKKLDLADVYPHAGFWNRLPILTPHSRYLLHHYVLPLARFTLGTLLALASAAIVWSEIVKFPFPRLSIIRLSVIHHWVGDKAQVGFAGQLIAALWISYMCTAALASVSQVRVWRGRALVQRNTGYEAAFWYAAQVAKLSVPLSYNFLTFLSPEVYRKTTFYTFLGRFVDVTPIGRWFDDFFPFFLVVPVMAACFGLYGKVKRLFINYDIIGGDDDDDDDENGMSHFGSGSWREGRDLIARELGDSASLRRDRAFGPPRLSLPTIQDAPSAAPRPSGHASGSRRLGPSRARPADDEPDEDSFFQILGHRMKNTVDSFETPQWLQDISQGITKPKWMRGNEEDTRWTGGCGGGSGHIRI